MTVMFTDDGRFSSTKALKFNYSIFRYPLKVLMGLNICESYFFGNGKSFMSNESNPLPITHYPLLITVRNTYGTLTLATRPAIPTVRFR